MATFREQEAAMIRDLVAARWQPPEPGSYEVFYVTVQRGTGTKTRTGALLGPYSTKADAEHDVPAARRLARDVDPFTAFDAFGVTRSVWTTIAAIPRGKLNTLAAERARAQAA
jgi:hypothetical protein